ncbi:hypothetical protein C922_01495 [Plasmodium inui San Antonio 1]|uniref:Endonuclease/exonuclease/phosphatase domain-containing protein n=1 Tax=Plasmodium inui San Antonio 1 TaxID=1237626 RepID=W7A9D6_9APIC|nr:hypothetical protein C922_01495 [Plasmodium inui San Antonio 1]EUD67883.1 hypothetical protein C922_01495 [Plasmodium inui San Antonio 1]
MKDCVRKNSPCTYDHTRQGNPKRGGEIASAATGGKAFPFSLCPHDGLKKKRLFDWTLEDGPPLGTQNKQHLRLEQGTHASGEQLLCLVLLEWLIERLIDRLIDRLVLHAPSEVKNRMRNFLLHCIKNDILCLCKLIDVAYPTDIRNLSYEDGEGRIVHPTIDEPLHPYKEKVTSEDCTNGACSRVRANRITKREQKNDQLRFPQKHHSSGPTFSHQAKIRKPEKINLTLHLCIERKENTNLENPLTVVSAFLKNEIMSSRQKTVQNSDPRLYIHRMVQNKCHFIHGAKGKGLFLKEFPPFRGMLHIIITHKRTSLVFYLIVGEIFFFVCCLLNTSLAQVNGSTTLFFEIYLPFGNVYTIRHSHGLFSYLAHTWESGLSVFSSKVCWLGGDPGRGKDLSSVGTDKREKNGKCEKNDDVNNPNRARQRDKRARTKLRFTKSSTNHLGDEPQEEYSKHPDKTHKVNINAGTKKRRASVNRLVDRTGSREKSSTNRSQDETRMSQNGAKPNSPRRTCGNHKGDDQNEENEKENDNDNYNKEETGSRRSGNRNGDKRSGRSNGDRHNNDDNNNNDSDDDGDEDGGEDGGEDGEDDKEEDENDEENDEDDKKKAEGGKPNGQGGKQEAGPSDVIAEESDEQKGEPNDTDDACGKAKGKEIKSEADDVKNGATDMQRDSNQGDGNGNKEDGEGVKVDSVDEDKDKLAGQSSAGENRPNINMADTAAQRSSEAKRANNEENQNNIKKNINAEESNSEGDRSGGMESHIRSNCRSSSGCSDQRNDQTGKDERDEKNLRIMNKMLKNLSFMSFNTGLLEYKICGVCIYQNPPFISNRLLHIPFALKRTNADIIALQEVYDEKHVEYLKNHLMPKYPFYARDNYCSDVFKEKFSDVNVAREDGFREGSRQDGRDGLCGRNGPSERSIPCGKNGPSGKDCPSGKDSPSDRTANSYENSKRTGTSANNPNGGNKKEPRCRKKKYFALHHGLLVFSKYPIIYSFFHGFKHVTYLEHIFGTKGFLEVVIDVPFFSYITLVNMHLASGAADTESKYIERVRDFEIKQIMEIARNAEKRNTIPIIIGDLNAAPNLCPNNYSSFIKRGWKDAWLYARNVKKKKTKQLIGKALPRLQKKKTRTISPNSCHSFSHLFPRVAGTSEDVVNREAKKAEREGRKETVERREREVREETEEHHPSRNDQEGVKNKHKGNPLSGITNNDNAYSNHSVNANKSIYFERPSLDNKVHTKNDELGSRSSMRVFPSFNRSENNDSIVYSNSGKTLSTFCNILESYDSMYHNEAYTEERKKWNVGDNSVEFHASVCLSRANFKNDASEMDKMNSALNNGALNKRRQSRNCLQSRYSECVSHAMTARSGRRAVTGVPSKMFLIRSKKVTETVSKTIWRRKGNFLPESYKRVKRHHRKGCTRKCHKKEHLPHVKRIPSSRKNQALKLVDNMSPSQRGNIPHCTIIPNSSTANGKDNPSDVIPERKGETQLHTDEMHYGQMSPLSTRADHVVDHQKGDHDLLESILHVSKTQDDLFNPPTGEENGPNCCADKRDKGEKKERQRNVQSCSTGDVFIKEDKIGSSIVTQKCTLRSKIDGDKLKIHREEDEYHAATNLHHHYNSDHNLFSSDISSESNHSYTDLYDDEEEANWFSDRSSNVSRNDLHDRTEVAVPLEAEPSGMIYCMKEEGFTNGDTTEKAPETIKELDTSGSNQLTDKKCANGEDKIMTHCISSPEMGEYCRGEENTPQFHPKETAQVGMSNEKGDDNTSTHAQMQREEDSKLSVTTTFYKNQLSGHKEKVRNVHDNCEDKLKIENLCSAFLNEELARGRETHKEPPLLSEVGTRRDGNDWNVTYAIGKNDAKGNSCNDQMESPPYTSTQPAEENANINTNEKKKKISKLAKKIKQMKKKLFYNILRNYEKNHDGGVKKRTPLKGKQGEPQMAKHEREEGNLFTLEDVKQKAERNHHIIASLNERERTVKESNCKGEVIPAEDHSLRIDVSEALKNQVTNEKGKNKSSKFLHFTKKWYNSRTQETLKKDIFYFIKKLKFKATNKLKQKFCICAKNVKDNLSEGKKLVLMEKEQKGELQQFHNKCPFVQNNSDLPRSFSSIKLADDFIKMCECTPMSKKEKNQRGRNYNQGDARTKEGPENSPKSKKYFIFKRRQKEEKDRNHIVENMSEGRILLDDHNCVSPNRNASKNKKCTHGGSPVGGGEPNQGQLHNKMNLNMKNKSFLNLTSEENISSDEYTWDPLNPLNVLGPHSRCNGLRCDYIFFPPISYNNGKGAKGGKNVTAEKGNVDQKGKPSAAEKTDEAYKMGAIKSQPCVDRTKMPNDEQLVMGREKAQEGSNMPFDPVGANRETQKCSNSVWNTQNYVLTQTHNKRGRKDDHQAKGKRYEEALDLKKYNDLKILKHYYIKSAKILFNEPSVMVHTYKSSKNFNCCYSFCMKIKNVHFVTMSDHYAIKIDLRLKKNHKFVRNS